MNLSFNDLKKRDVINVVDGRCLGNITDIDLSFPLGKLVGIIVPGKKLNFLLKLFDRSKIYIPESNITKIGGDVILVNINCGEACSRNVKVNPQIPPISPCNPCGIGNSPQQNLQNGNRNDLGLNELDLGDY